MGAQEAERENEARVEEVRGIKNKRVKEKKGGGGSQQRQKLTTLSFSFMCLYILLLFRECSGLCNELRSG